MTYGEIGAQRRPRRRRPAEARRQKGTKVGLFLPNCPTFIVYYFAILKAGGTVVNYNPLYTLEELTFQVKDSETEMMVTLDLKVLFDKVEALLKAGVPEARRSSPRSRPCCRSPSRCCSSCSRRKELARPPASPVAAKHRRSKPRCWQNDGTCQSRSRSIPLNDVAVLQYTGGTTGTPKGAMLTHANVYINAQQVAAWAPDLVARRGARAGRAAVLPRVRA